MKFETLNLIFKCGREFSHRRIRGMGMSETEFLLCSYVSGHPLCSQEEAVRALRIDKTTVAKALAKLEERKLITRDTDSIDKRRKKLDLTAEGREKMRGLYRLHDEWFEAVVSKALTPEEQETFEADCQKLLKAALEMSTERNQEAENGSR